MRRIRVNRVIQTKENSTKRYKLLMFASTWFIFMAWFSGIVAVGGVFFGLLMGRHGYLIMLYFLIGGSTACISNLTFSEIIKLLIEVARHTRRVAEAAERQD